MEENSRRMRLADLFCQDPNNIAKAIEHWINLKPVWPDQTHLTHLLENFHWQWKLQDLFEALKLAAIRSETARQVLKDAEGDPCLDFKAAISAAGGHVAEGQNFEAAAEHIGYFQQAMQHYIDGFLADFIAFQGRVDNSHETIPRTEQNSRDESEYTESLPKSFVAEVVFEKSTDWLNEQVKAGDVVAITTKKTIRVHGDSMPKLKRKHERTAALADWNKSRKQR